VLFLYIILLLHLRSYAFYPKTDLVKFIAFVVLLLLFFCFTFYPNNDINIPASLFTVEAISILSIYLYDTAFGFTAMSLLILLVALILTIFLAGRLNRRSRRQVMSFYIKQRL